MEGKKGTGLGLLYMVILMAVVLGLRHFELLQAPNAYFIGDSLDGFRTMVANFFHIRHDVSFDHFSGMHYPYGDHIGYADTFPLLSNATKHYFNNDTTWFPAVWNLSLVFSQLLCGVFLFLVFRELELPLWYSMLAALGISTLTPQIDRFAAHYCLSFAFVLPLTICLLIRFGKKPKLSLSILLALVLLLANLIHPYHMAMVAFLIAGYFFFRFCYQPSWKNFRWLASHALIQLVIPLAYLIFSTVWADTITDRPAWPWGFTFFNTRLQSLLLPIDLPFGHWINQNITYIQYVQTETRAYLGMVVIFGGLLLLVRTAIKRFSSSASETKKTLVIPTLQYLLWAAFIILLFAACMPFKLFDWEWMTDYLGYLRQFRALGRFAWVFFYVANVAVLYGLFHWIQEAKSPGLQKFWYGLVLTVLLVEGVGYLFWESYELHPRPENRELFSRAENPWLYTLELEKYQGILPLPFFHIGSENFWMSPGHNQLHRVMWAGVESGLPVMGSFMGRTSIGQTINLLEFIAEPYRRPAILDDFPDQRPLLVFVSKKEFRPIGYRYNHLMRKMTQLYEDEHIKLYELPLSALEENVVKRQKAFRAEVDTVAVYTHDNLLSKDEELSTVYQSFDDQRSLYAYQGGGAKALASFTDHVFFNDHLPAQQTDKSTVVSVWAKMDDDLAGRTKMRIAEYLPETGEVLDSMECMLGEYIRSVDAGWILTDIPFKLKRSDTKVKIVFKNYDVLWGNDFYLDEFLIRQASDRLYRKEDDRIMVNNRWILR